MVSTRFQTRRPDSGPDVSWLADVRAYGPALDYCDPIRFEERTVCVDTALPPPHSHHYFEFGLLLEGAVKMRIGTQEIDRRAGDLFIAGQGLPHSAYGLSFPVRYCVVYFQPWILLESESSESHRILDRFAVGQPIQRYLITPASETRSDLLRMFEAMGRESRARAFGWKLQLRSLVVQMLVLFLRSEIQNGPPVDHSETTPSEWKSLQKALRYLHGHFAEPLYGQKLAEAVGLSESRLQTLFRSRLGMSWVQYLQHYRIQRAKALLSDASMSVTEAAFAVGYESLSHFNATFSSLTGMSPSRYRKNS